MNTRRLVAAGFAALALAASAQAADTRIRLHAQAEPRTARYTLGEVAEIRGADAGLVQALAATEVGLTPRIGQAESVPRNAIVQRVESQHPALRGALQWRGAEAVTVRAGGEPLDATALHRLAERTLIESLEARGLRSVVQAVGRPEALRLPAGARLSARLAEGWAPARRMCVWIDVEAGGRGYRSVPVWFTVKAQQPVLVARHSVRAGESLRAENLETAWVDIATLRSPPLPATAALTGLRLKRAVEAGEPLLIAAVEARPAVQRNQAVDVQLALGAIRLQLAGIALRDARLGESIKVRNPVTNEQFVALVVSEGTVRVEAR